MPLDATANFVRGETDSSTDSIQTTVSVVDASIFPDPATQGEYNVVIWDVADYPRPDQDPDVEILRVTATDTTNDDLTVTRGQEGTSGASHPLGSAVHLSPTAKMFGDIEGTFNEFYDDGAQELTADVNNDSVNTKQASITEMTEVKAKRSSDVNLGNNVWTGMADSEVDDVNGDYDNDELTIPESGKYQVYGIASITPGASGDVIAGRLSGGGNAQVGARLFQVVANSTDDLFVPFKNSFTADAGETFEVQVNNFNSSWTLRANSVVNYERVIIQ